MNKVFIFTTRDANWITGTAMAEDGTCLAQAASLVLPLPSNGIDLATDDKLALYAAHYPGGYELEEVTDPKNHAGLTAAYVLYEAANPS